MDVSEGDCARVGTSLIVQGIKGSGRFRWRMHSRIDGNRSVILTYQPLLEEQTLSICCHKATAMKVEDGRPRSLP